MFSNLERYVKGVYNLDATKEALARLLKFQNVKYGHL